MFLALLQDGKHSCRGFVPAGTSRACRNADADAVSVDVDQLMWQRHHNHHGTPRRHFWPPDALPVLERPDRGDAYSDGGRGRRHQWGQVLAPAIELKGLDIFTSVIATSRYDIPQPCFGTGCPAPLV